MPIQRLDVDSNDSDDNENDIDSISNVIKNDLGSTNVLLSHGPPDSTDRLRHALPADDSMKASLVVEALSGLASLGLNVPLLLELMSWGNLHCRNDLKIKTSRTELMQYKGLAQLLTTWHRPPPPAAGGKRPAGACDVMEDWAFNIVIDIVSHELDQLVAPLLKSPPKVTAKSLLSIDLKAIVIDMEASARRTWGLVRRMVYTPKQEKRNTQKDPTAVCLPRKCCGICA